MKKNILSAVLICTFILSGSSLFAQNQKLAQTGMKFLSLSLDARASGLSQATTALENKSASLFYNPAGMARQANFVDVSLGLVQYIADIKYQFGGITFAPSEGRYGVVGISLMNVNYGDFMGTVRADNTQGFVDVGTFSPKAMAIGLGYAKALSEKFAVGGNIKYVYQSLGTSVVNSNPTTGSLITEENKANVIAFDFGVLYKTGFKSLTFGMDVRNFSREVRYKQDGFQLPLVFKIGLAMNIIDIFPQIDNDMHSFTFSVDASHPRDYPEQVSVGGEYTFMKLVSIRAGYTTPTDIEKFSAGIGLKHRFYTFDFGIDYSYTASEVFKDVQRISVSFGL